jgi:hypothetical protein
MAMRSSGEKMGLVIHLSGLLQPTERFFRKNPTLTGRIDRLHGNATVMGASDGAFSADRALAARIAKVLPGLKAQHSRIAETATFAPRSTKGVYPEHRKNP